MCTRIRLRQSEFDVSSVGCIVVDPAPGVQDATVSVVGELVEAGVCHQHRVLAEILRQVAQRDVQDAVFGHADRPGGILVLITRNTEQHETAHARSHRIGRGPPQRVAGVLHDARHRGDGPGFRYAVGDEHR
jgi:hypothetical protein